MDVTNATPNQLAEQPAVEESLTSYFQRSATIVRQYADVIEQDYAQPISRYASIKFKETPIAMTFLSIFAGLSALPVLSFIGLTIFAYSSIAFLAFTFAAIAFVSIEAIFVSCLVFALGSLFVVAGFTMVIVVFVYLTVRLGVLVTHEGFSGVTDWAYETQQHFSYAKKRESTGDSDGSAVLVDRDVHSPKKPKVKVEEETPLSD